MTLIENVAISLTGIDSMHNKKHVHYNGIEIMYIIKGKGTFLVENKVFDIKPNMLIVIDSDTLHCSNHSKECEYLRDRILFDKKQFMSLLTLCDENIENLLQKCFFTEENIHHLFEKILKSDDGIEKLHLTLKILENCTNEKKSGTSLIDIILAFIEANLENMLNAQVIAENVHISSSHLYHLFKEKTGFALMEYIKLRRVEKAKALLRNSDLTVSQISIMCGYDNFSHFSRVFHLIAGVSPNQYRKKTRE